jgi:hypothetical protein
VDQDLEEMAEQGAGDLESGVGWGGEGEGIADDGLDPLVNTEGEAADAAVIERDVAGKDLGLEVLEEELGGAAIVPAQLFAPEEGLLLEQGTELPRVEMTNVEDLYLGRCRQFPCHLEREYRSWELDGKRWGGASYFVRWDDLKVWGGFSWAARKVWGKGVGGWAGDEGKG